MSAHVYECDGSELEALKRLLAYDPYLDPNVIPPSVPGADKPADKRTAEEKAAVAERDLKVEGAMKRLREDRFSDVIFTRQEYELFDGAALGLQPGKSYLYLKANDGFLAKADELLPLKFRSVKRVTGEAEQKVLAKVSEQEESANAGFGSIFG